MRRLLRVFFANGVRASVAAAVVFCAECGASKPPVVDFTSAPRTYRSEDYQEVYERWTRHDKVIHDVESALGDLGDLQEPRLSRGVRGPLCRGLFTWRSRS